MVTRSPGRRVPGCQFGGRKVSAGRAGPSGAGRAGASSGRLRASRGAAAVCCLATRPARPCQSPAPQPQLRPPTGPSGGGRGGAGAHLFGQSTPHLHHPPGRTGQGEPLGCQRSPPPGLGRGPGGAARLFSGRPQPESSSRTASARPSRSFPASLAVAQGQRGDQGFPLFTPPPPSNPSCKRRSPRADPLNFPIRPAPSPTSAGRYQSLGKRPQHPHTNPIHINTQSGGLEVPYFVGPPRAHRPISRARNTETGRGPRTLFRSSWQVS